MGQYTKQWQADTNSTCATQSHIKCILLKNTTHASWWMRHIDLWYPFQWHRFILCTLRITYLAMCITRIHTWYSFSTLSSMIFRTILTLPHTLIFYIFYKSFMCCLFQTTNLTLPLLFTQNIHYMIYGIPSRKIYVTTCTFMFSHTTHTKITFMNAGKTIILLHKTNYQAAVYEVNTVVKKRYVLVTQPTAIRSGRNLFDEKTNCQGKEAHSYCGIHIYLFLWHWKCLQGKLLRS